MSVHSLDWDDVLNKPHHPAAAISLPDSLSDGDLSELSESSAADVPDEPYEPSEASEPGAAASEPEELEAEELEEGSKPRSPIYGHYGSAPSEISELSAESDGYKPNPFFTQDTWGELKVDTDYKYDWGEPSRDDDWLGWVIDPPYENPIWRQENIITKMAEYQIISQLVYQDEDAEEPILVEDVVYSIEEATYFVLGLIKFKKLRLFQINVVVWKHLVNVYRTLYHLAVETERYDDLVDVLVGVSKIQIIHPDTGRHIGFYEEDRLIGKIWQDLPILYRTMRDELAFVSNHLCEGEKAPEIDVRRTHLEKVITFTAKIVARLRVEIPNDDGPNNQSPYLKAGEFFKVAFGRLQNWNFPDFDDDDNSVPMPRPTEWAIRGAALWMIHAADFFRKKISDNEKVMAAQKAEDIWRQQQKNPYGPVGQYKEMMERLWFPPWDHGPQVYRYPGSDVFIDGYSGKDFDVMEWAEWTQANGLNYFREQSWKAWGDGFTAVLDAITKDENEIFAGGKRMSRDTEDLVRQALNAMTEAEEHDAARKQFERDTGVICY